MLDTQSSFGALLAVAAMGWGFAARGVAAAPASEKPLRLIQAGFIRCTVDQQPCVQGFYPVVQLVLYLRYGILPADIDAGSTIIDRSNVERVIPLTEEKHR